MFDMRAVRVQRHSHQIAANALSVFFFDRAVCESVNELCHVAAD